MAAKSEPIETSEEIDVEEGVAVHKRHHKDGLHRYTNVRAVDGDKDHYLEADNGKLELLRVQKAPFHSSRYRSQGDLKTTWSEPLEPNLFKSMWQRFRGAPRSITTWTFNDSLKCKF